MDNSIQHGSSSQLPDPSDLNDQYGPEFLSAEARAEQHLDAVESLFIASSAGMDPDEFSDLTASLSTIRALLTPEGHVRATRTENRNGIDPRGNRAAGTRTTSELVVELASGEPHGGLPANLPPEPARDGLASGEPHGGSPANLPSEPARRR